MTISSAAAPIVPQASAVSAKSSPKTDVDFAESPFAQALAVAGFSLADTSAATSLSAAPKPVGVAPRAGRNTKSQAKQEATQSTTPATATSAVSVPAPAAAPLESIALAFPWDREASVPAEQSSATESAETSQPTSPLGTSASTAAQPAIGGATQIPARWSADSTRGTYASQQASESAANEDSVPPATPAQPTSVSEANPASVSASSSISAPQSSESRAASGTAAASSRSGKFGTSTSFADIAGSGFVQAMAAAGFTLPVTPSDTSLSSASQPVDGTSRAQANAKPEASTATDAASALTPAAASPAGQSVQAQPLASVLAEAVPSATSTPAASEDRQARAVSGQSFAARAAYAWQPTITASQTSASASAPADLAIAARVQPAGEQISGTRATAPAAQTAASASTSDSASVAPVQTATGTADRRTAQREAPAAAQASSRRTVESSGSDATVVPPAAASSGSSAASYAHAFVQAEGPSTAAASSATQEPAAAPAAPAEAATIPEAKLTSASAPLKDISIQVAQPGAQKVEVRVVQQSGELRVAVRTGDSDLAHGLQQNLSDLVGRLQESGFRAEGWRPAGSTVESPAPLDTRSTSNTPSRDGNQQSNSGGSQGQGGERQQSRSQRPAWLEELEANINGNAWSQGASHGIGS